MINRTGRDPIRVNDTLRNGAGRMTGFFKPRIPAYGLRGQEGTKDTGNFECRTSSSQLRVFGLGFLGAVGYVLRVVKTAAGKMEKQLLQRNFG